MIRKKRETTQVDMFDDGALKIKRVSEPSGNTSSTGSETAAHQDDTGNPILMGYKHNSVSAKPFMKEDSGELISFDQILKSHNLSEDNAQTVSGFAADERELTPDTDEFSSQPVIEEDTDDVIINKDFADGFYPGKRNDRHDSAELTRKTELIRQRRKKRYMKLVMIAVLLLTIITALNWNEWVTQSSLFTVKTIEVTGNDIADKTDIIQWSGIQKGERLGGIDAPVVAERISKQPLFKNAVISKHYPSTVQIRVEERKPVAFIAMDELYAMDSDGFILPKLKTIRSYNLPVISGLRAALKTGSELKAPGIKGIRKLLKTAQSVHPAMYFDISEIEYRKDGLRLFLNQWPMPFIIDPEAPERSLVYLDAASDYFKKNPPGRRIKEIDLRYEHKMIVRNK